MFLKIIFGLIINSLAMYAIYLSFYSQAEINLLRNIIIASLFLFIDYLYVFEPCWRTTRQKIFFSSHIVINTDPNKILFINFFSLLGTMLTGPNIFEILFRLFAIILPVYYINYIIFASRYKREHSFHRIYEDYD